MIDEARMRKLEADVQRMRDMLYQRPIIVPAASASPTFYIINNIEGGTTLWSSGLQTITGIQYNGATSITTVPNTNAATPAIGTFAVGLGRGTILGSSGKVYVALRPDPGSGVTEMLLSDIPNSSVILSISKVAIPLVSDSSVLVDVYIPYRF